MPFFSAAYDKVLAWARHPRAPWYLAGLGFAESSFFPVPPDIMLAPMVLARPERAWRLAAVTTLASALGGLFGYLIGMFAFELVEPVLHRLGYWDAYLQARTWFATWGVWVVFLAGFSPIPYKIFTISAGAVSMAVVPFFAASVIGRGARFFLVAGLIRWGGIRMEAYLRRYIDRIGWFAIGAAVVVYILVR